MMDLGNEMTNYYKFTEQEDFSGYYDLGTLFSTLKSVSTYTNFDQCIYGLHSHNNATYLKNITKLQLQVILHQLAPF